MADVMSSGLVEIVREGGGARVLQPPEHPGVRQHLPRGSGADPIGDLLDPLRLADLTRPIDTGPFPVHSKTAASRRRSAHARRVRRGSVAGIGPESGL